SQVDFTQLTAERILRQIPRSTRQCRLHDALRLFDMFQTQRMPELVDHQADHVDFVLTRVVATEKLKVPNIDVNIRLVNSAADPVNSRSGLLDPASIPIEIKADEVHLIATVIRQLIGDTPNSEDFAAD